MRGVLQCIMRQVRWLFIFVFLSLWAFLCRYPCGDHTIDSSSSSLSLCLSVSLPVWRSDHCFCMLPFLATILHLCHLSWIKWRSSNTARAQRTACMPSTTPRRVPRWWGIMSGVTSRWTPPPSSCSIWPRWLPQVCWISWVANANVTYICSICCFSSSRNVNSPFVILLWRFNDTKRQC